MSIHPLIFPTQTTPAAVCASCSPACLPPYHYVTCGTGQDGTGTGSGWSGWGTVGGLGGGGVGSFHEMEDHPSSLYLLLCCTCHAVHMHALLAAGFSSRQSKHSPHTPTTLPYPTTPSHLHCPTHTSPFTYPLCLPCLLPLPLPPLFLPFSLPILPPASCLPHPPTHTPLPPPPTHPTWHVSHHLPTYLPCSAPALSLSPFSLLAACGCCVLYTCNSHDIPCFVLVDLFVTKYRLTDNFVGFWWENKAENRNRQLGWRQVLLGGRWLVCGTGFWAPLHVRAHFAARFFLPPLPACTAPALPPASLPTHTTPSFYQTLFTHSSPPHTPTTTCLAARAQGLAYPHPSPSTFAAHTFPYVPSTPDNLWLAWQTVVGGQDLYWTSQTIHPLPLCDLFSTYYTSYLLPP